MILFNRFKIFETRMQEVVTMDHNGEEVRSCMRLARICPRFATRSEWLALLLVLIMAERGVRRHGRCTYFAWQAFLERYTPQHLEVMEDHLLIFDLPDKTNAAILLLNRYR